MCACPTVFAVCLLAFTPISTIFFLSPEHLVTLCQNCAVTSGHGCHKCQVWSEPSGNLPVSLMKPTQKWLKQQFVNWPLKTNWKRSQSHTLRSIRKGSCPNPFNGFTLWSESFEGYKGPNNCFLKCPSVSSSRGHTEALSSCKKSAQRIMGARSDNQLYPSKSFIPKGPLKWLVLSTSVWYHPSIWRPWLFSPQRAIYPVWNAPILLMLKCTNLQQKKHVYSPVQKIILVYVANLAYHDNCEGVIFIYITHPFKSYLNDLALKFCIIKGVATWATGGLPLLSTPLR